MSVKKDYSAEPGFIAPCCWASKIGEVEKALALVNPFPNFLVSSWARAKVTSTMINRAITTFLSDKVLRITNCN